MLNCLRLLRPCLREINRGFMNFCWSRLNKNALKVRFCSHRFLQLWRHTIFWRPPGLLSGSAFPPPRFPHLRHWPYRVFSCRVFSLHRKKTRHESSVTTARSSLLLPDLRYGLLNSEVQARECHPAPCELSGVVTGHEEALRGQKISHCCLTFYRLRGPLLWAACSTE